MKFILCLCDLTGIMAEPWLDAGYSAILIDPQHEQSSVTTHGGGGVVIKVSAVIDSPDSWSVIKNHINTLFLLPDFHRVLTLQYPALRTLVESVRQTRIFKQKRR